MMRKKKALTSNPNTIETETTKSDKINLDPNCEFCLKKMPISLGRIERIKDSLRTWLDNNPEAKVISDFYYAMDISMKTYYRLLERDPELKELHDMTMRRLGNKLWGRSVDNKANWNAVKFMLHSYAPEFKEAREYEAALSKKDDSTDKGPQIVVIEKFPNSDLVPVKKENR